eukprot:1185991-Rhodomonas_salina.2
MESSREGVREKDGVVEAQPGGLKSLPLHLSNQGLRQSICQFQMYMLLGFTFPPDLDWPRSRRRYHLLQSMDSSCRHWIRARSFLQSCLSSPQRHLPCRGSLSLMPGPNGDEELALSNWRVLDIDVVPGKEQTKKKRRANSHSLVQSPG